MTAANPGNCFMASLVAALLGCLRLSGIGGSSMSCICCGGNG